MGVRVWQDNLIYQENKEILALGRFTQEEGEAKVELLFCRCHQAAHKIFLYFFKEIYLFNTQSFVISYR